MMEYKQVVLKPFKWDDAPLLYEMIKVTEVHRYLDMIVDTYENYAKWLQHIEWLEYIGEAYHRTIWNEINQCIGEVYLTNMDQETGVAEIGTWIGEEYWGKGYNHSIKERVLFEAFTDLKIVAVLFFVQEENHRSIRSILKMPYISEAKTESYQKMIQYKEYKIGKPIKLWVVKKEDFLQSS